MKVLPMRARGLIIESHVYQDKRGFFSKPIMRRISRDAVPETFGQESFPVPLVTTVARITCANAATPASLRARHGEI